MSDERTIDIDGDDVHVTDTAEESETLVVGATVSGSQKENLGNYENIEPHASVRVEFRPAFALAGNGSEVQERLGKLRALVNNHLQESIDSVVSGREMSHE